MVLARAPFTRSAAHAARTAQTARDKPQAAPIPEASAAAASPAERNSPDTSALQPSAAWAAEVQAAATELESQGPTELILLGAPETQTASVMGVGHWSAALERRVLGLASALLGVLLLAQLVHHYRAEIAPLSGVGGGLSAIYAALGMPVTPRWDLSAYEVRQLGAVAGVPRPGTLTVRASIKNTATVSQPLPLLRVIVQDRFGNRVAARDVTPAAYLPHRSATAMLAPGERIDTEIAFVDPGPSAEGFELDACLAQSGGRVRCANEEAPVP